MARPLSDDEIRAQFEAAVRRGARSLTTEPHAEGARYNARARAVMVKLTNGATFSFPIALVDALRDATDAQLAEVEVGPAGVALSWPALDEDLSVAGLARLVFGGRAVARAAAARAGSVRSEAKAEAARENGRKGGRPRKNITATGIKKRASTRPAARDTGGRSPSGKRR